MSNEQLGKRIERRVLGPNTTLPGLWAIAEDVTEHHGTTDYIKKVLAEIFTIEDQREVNKLAQHLVYPSGQLNRRAIEHILIHKGKPLTNQIVQDHSKEERRNLGYNYGDTISAFFEVLTNKLANSELSFSGKDLTEKQKEINQMISGWEENGEYLENTVMIYNCVDTILDKKNIDALLVFALPSGEKITIPIDVTLAEKGDTFSRRGILMKIERSLINEPVKVRPSLEYTSLLSMEDLETLADEAILRLREYLEGKENHELQEEKDYEGMRALRERMNEQKREVVLR